MGLTHQEAQEIVNRAKSRLDDFREVSGSGTDLAFVLEAVDDYLKQTVNHLIANASPDDFQEGLRRYGVDGLEKLIKDSIRLHLSPDITQRPEQEMLIKVDRYLYAADGVSTTRGLAPFAANLSKLVDKTSAAMGTGWWLFPTRARKRVYSSCEKINKLMESDAGVAIERLSRSLQSPNQGGWKQTQKDLVSRPQAFAAVLQQVAPGFLADETAIVGLTDAQASRAEGLVHQADELLDKVKAARTSNLDMQEIRSALDAYLTSWTDQIVTGTPTKLREEIGKFYKQDHLRAATRGLLRINPSTTNANLLMQRLIMAGDKYRLLERVKNELPRNSRTADELLSLLAQATRVKQDLPWLFLTDEEKESALAACDGMASFLETDEIASLKKLCSDVERVNSLSWDAARKDMEKSSGEIVSILKLAAPEVISDVSSVGGLTDGMIANAGQAIKDVDELLAEVKEAKTVKPQPQPIEDAVDAYRHSRAVTAVACAPIDVLNQGARQFQLKGLKEAGYDTVGSILDVSAYVLEDIPGMGRGVAYEARQMARDYADYQAESARVQLSLDDKSPQMDGLLMALGTYRAIASAQKQISSSRSTINTISRLSKKAESLRPDLVWVLMTQNERQEHIDAGRDLLEYLDGPEVQALQNAVDLALCTGTIDVSRARKDFAQDPVGFAATLEKLVPDAMGGDNGAYGLSDELAEKASAVEFSSVGLKVTLRPYQVWGVKFALAQKRVLLGDEMGLGKTIQALAVMAALRAMGYRRFMVVCPLSVLENWDREVKEKSDFIRLFSTMCET